MGSILWASSLKSQRRGNRAKNTRPLKNSLETRRRFYLVTVAQRCGADLDFLIGLWDLKAGVTACVKPPTAVSLIFLRAKMNPGA